MSEEKKLGGRTKDGWRGFLIFGKGSQFETAWDAAQLDKVLDAAFDASAFTRGAEAMREAATVAVAQLESQQRMLAKQWKSPDSTIRKEHVDIVNGLAKASASIRSLPLPSPEAQKPTVKP